MNYDCGLYNNLFENLTKVLSKNAFPQDRIILATHQLAVEGLLVVLDGIENSRQSTTASHLLTFQEVCYFPLHAWCSLPIPYQSGECQEDSGGMSP